MPVIYRFFVGLLAIYVGLMAYMIPFLGPMMIPVMVYALVLCIMVYFANVLAGISHQKLLRVGAFAFLLSDLTLAFDKFIQTIPYAPYIIIGTYILAQYSIIRGLAGINRQMTI